MKFPKVNPSWAAWLGLAAIAGLVGYLSGGKVVIPTPPAPDEPVFVTTGWVDDQEAVRAAVQVAGIGEFADTPAGKVAKGPEEEAFLWRAVRQVAGTGRPADWYSNINQEDVGCCVGGGYKHAIDVLQATQIAQGRPAEWKPVSVEGIYAGSRVEIGGGRINGDGSVGAWAAACVQKLGTLPMEKIGNQDLSVFSPAKARAWGRTGIPDDLEPIAREHIVKTTALVKSWTDVQRAVLQGYTVPVCSNQGFSMTRDSQGFARPQGTWNHCMAIIGVRGGPRPGGFILNSWGDRAHTGPVWPSDAPVAGFWADADVIDRMVRQGDSFALSDAVGFPSRKLDWFVQQAPPAKRLADPVFAIAW